MEIAALVVAGVFILALAILFLASRMGHRSKEADILRDLGFIEQDPPPVELMDALHQLYADKEEKTEFHITRCLRLRIRAADLCFVDFERSGREKRSPHQTLRSLHAVNPSWNLPALTVLTWKEPEGLAERMISQALDAVMSKHRDHVDLSAYGDFASRARAFAEDESAARLLLTPPVRKALLALPYSLFEVRRIAFCLGRPAQAGRGKGGIEEWRLLTETVRALAEQMPHSPSAPS
jgi:hypothetical protein